MKFKPFLAVLAVLSFVALAIIFWPNSCTSTTDPPVTVSPKQIESVQKKIEREVDHQLNALRSENQKLAQEASRAKAQLAKHQAAARKWESMLLQFKNEAAKSTGTEYADTAPIDTASIIMSIVDNSRARDSLCNETITLLEAKAQNKEDANQQLENLYASTKANLLLAVDGQKALQASNSQLTRKLKWKKAGNTIWKSAAVVLAGILIHQQLK